ncbi:Exocyst complex component Sec10-like - like 2 [Theobroma cacao]|nr:Exocyst complex component Sec10-like - like 2 [Theobroma cacao]
MVQYVLGDFSFDALFGNLVNELLPSFQEEEADTADGHSIGGTDVLPNGHIRVSSDATKFAQGLSAPLFPEVDALLSLFKDSCRELVDLRKQSADAQRETASQTIELIKPRGTSAMQHYVATRPMFIDVEVMNSDTRLVLGNQGSQASPSNVARGLSSLYKEITDTIRKEAATIMAVFPSPNDVMSILVQRVLEQRVTTLLDKLLSKPSLVNPPPIEEGGLLLYLRMLAVAYEKTQELARDLRAVGCGLTESLFSVHKDEYPEHEQASLRQLYQAKLEELRAESQKVSESSGTIGRSKGASVASSHQPISVAVVTDQYITDGLERARDNLTEAAALRERFVLGTNLSRRVAAAAASAAEAAAAAGESSFRSFMVAVQRCGSSVAIVQQYFANSISRLLLLVDGAHAASCEEMATAMSSAEGAAYKGLQQCIETVMAEGNRLHKGLLIHWQKFTFNPSGGLRLKRDITEYGEFVRSFNAPSVDEKFELLGILANVFIVAPESLSTLFEGTPSIRKDAQSALGSVILVLNGFFSIVVANFDLSPNSGLFSLGRTTRVQNLRQDLALYGQVLVDLEVAC